MKIFLMQHGPSLPEAADPQQGLSPVGHDQVIKSATAMRQLGLSFDLVMASQKLRSVQTAELIAKALGYPASEIMQSDLLKPTASAEAVIEFLRENKVLGSVFIAGHQPLLGRLISRLISPDGKATVSVENCGLTCIEAEGFTRGASLVWHFPAKHLALML